MIDSVSIYHEQMYTDIDFRVATSINVTVNIHSDYHAHGMQIGKSPQLFHTKLASNTKSMGIRFIYTLFNGHSFGIRYSNTRSGRNLLIHVCC